MAICHRACSITLACRRAAACIGFFGEEGSFDVFFSLLIGAVMLLVLEEREHRITAISLGVDFDSWHLDWLRLGRLARPSAPCGIALARGLRLCVCLVQNSPRSSCEPGIGRRHLWCGLRLFTSGNHLGACLLRCGDGLARIVHVSHLIEVRNGCGKARPRCPQLLQLHYLGHGRVRRRDAIHAFGPDFGLDRGHYRPVLPCNPRGGTCRDQSNASH